jgi:hypothetical protein
VCVPTSFVDGKLINEKRQGIGWRTVRHEKPHAFLSHRWSDQPFQDVGYRIGFAVLRLNIDSDNKPVVEIGGFGNLVCH